MAVIRRGRVSPMSPVTPEERTEILTHPGRWIPPVQVPTTAFRSNYCPVGASVRSVTDPYLLSGNDDGPVPAVPAGKTDELARRMHVPRTMLEDMPPGILEGIEQSAARIEAGQKTWRDLADSIARKLTAAGFRRHDPLGQRGGFHLSLWEDGVIVAWSTTEYPEDSVSPFEKTVEHAMLPALVRILQATGFTARIIPEEEDNGGDIRVTGWQGPGGIKTVAEQ
jgi:hypothetical protein